MPPRWPRPAGRAERSARSAPERAAGGQRELYPFEPDWTLRPGEALAEILIDRQMSTEQAGSLTGLRPEDIEAVVSGSARIDGRIAERLARLGPPAQFWLNYQAGYDADIARGAKDVSEGAQP